MSASIEKAVIVSGIIEPIDIVPHILLWVITGFMFVSFISGIIRCYKSRKQVRDETDIKNMFNEDGTKNEHYAHKDYDPLPCFVFVVVLYFVRLLILKLL